MPFQLLGQDLYNEEAQMVVLLMRLAWLDLSHQEAQAGVPHAAFKPSRSATISKKRFSVDAQNGLLAAVTLRAANCADHDLLPQGTPENVTIVLEDGTGNQPAVAALSGLSQGEGQGVASGSGQVQEQLDWRFSTAIDGDEDPSGEWYDTAEEAVLAFAEGARSSSKPERRADQKRGREAEADDEEEERTTITTAADFWDGFSSDEVEGASRSSHGAVDRQSSGVAGSSSAEDNDDAYWAGYDQVETIVGEEAPKSLKSTDDAKLRQEEKEPTLPEAPADPDDALLMTFRGAWEFYRCSPLHLFGRVPHDPNEGVEEQRRRRFMELARQAAM